MVQHNHRLMAKRKQKLSNLEHNHKCIIDYNVAHVQRRLCFKFYEHWWKYRQMIAKKLFLCDPWPLKNSQEWSIHKYDICIVWGMQKGIILPNFINWLKYGQLMAKDTNWVFLDLAEITKVSQTVYRASGKVFICSVSPQLLPEIYVFESLDFWPYKIF